MGLVVGLKRLEFLAPCVPINQKTACNGRFTSYLDWSDKYPRIHQWPMSIWKKNFRTKKFLPFSTTGCAKKKDQNGTQLDLQRTPSLWWELGQTMYGSHGRRCTVGGFPPNQERIRGYFFQDGQVQLVSCMKVRSSWPVSSRPPLRAPLHVNGQLFTPQNAHRGPMRPIRFVKVT